MRRLDVDRMRRYVARTTPDHLLVPELVAAEGPEAVASYIAPWRRRMQLKHRGRDLTLTTYADPVTWDYHVRAARSRLGDNMGDSATRPVTYPPSRTRSDLH